MRIPERTLMVFLFASTILILGRLAAAQTASQQNGAEPQPQPKVSELSTYKYELDYNLYEIEDGKRVNTRTYKVQLTDHGVIKAGSRVPVGAGNNPSNTQPQYVDIGMVIDARIRSSEGHVFLATIVEMRDVAPDPSGQGTTPVIRSNRAESNVIVTLGQTMLLASIDDPRSKRRYDVEVKVTRE